MAAELPWTHADHGRRVPVDADQASDDPWIGIESSRPEIVTQHRFGADPRMERLVQRGEPSDRRPKPENREVISRDREASVYRRLGIAIERKRHQGQCGHVTRRRGRLPPVGEHWVRDVEKLAIEVAGDLHQTGRSLEARHTLEDDGIDEAEDGRARADPDGERECRGDQEHRPPGERSNGVPQVVDEVMHWCSRSWFPRSSQEVQTSRRAISGPRCIVRS